MFPKLITKVKQLILERQLIVPHDNILVAVSGGIDSVVLLDVLCQLRNSMNFEVSIAHYNYKLRGAESETDEDFVSKLAQKYSLRFFKECTTVDLSKMPSLQEQARNLRYEFFNTLAREYHFTKIAVGHNADDNAETIFLNFLRGSGLNGLIGISIQKHDGIIIRPLLMFPRREIELYAQEENLYYQCDSSNAKNLYTRNYIRNEIFPRLKQHVNHNLTETLLRNNTFFSELNNYLCKEYTTFYEKAIVEKNISGYVFSRTIFLQTPVFLQRYFIHKFLTTFIVAEITFSLVDDVLNFLNNETGSKYSLPNGCVAVRDRERIIFTHTIASDSFCYCIAPEEKYVFASFQFSSVLVKEEINYHNHSSDVEYIDAEKLEHPLLLRNWEHGDTFFPLGMDEEKKISDFFIDEKISVIEKKRIAILVSHGSIVWVCGLRLDDRFKITATTNKILKLSYSKTEQS
jgi:tRNA(Ile)-lysidine synthase